MTQSTALEEVDDRNVLSLVTDKLREIVTDLYGRHPEYQIKSEIELRETVFPSITADRMRISFWEEYQRAQDTNSQMVLKRVYGPFMTKTCFYNDFLKRDYNVAWMMSPPSEHFLSMKADLHTGKDELGKVLRMKLFTEDGSLKVEEAKIFIKVFEIYSNRLFGSAIQRIEQKTQAIAMAGLDGDPDELRRELEERKKERGIIEITNGQETT